MRAGSLRFWASIPSNRPMSLNSGPKAEREAPRSDSAMETAQSVINPDDPILVTGAAGFIGSRVVECLVNRGFRNLRCFARPTGDPARMEAIVRSARNAADIEVITGNLLSREDCVAATRDVAVIYHLAAGRGEKSFPDAFMNSVVTTRNLLEGSLRHGCLRRFVSISSLSVYTNTRKPGGRLLDESCPTENRPELRGDAYSFAKAKQDEIVIEYGKKFKLPYVIVRPGFVY